MIRTEQEYQKALQHLAQDRDLLASQRQKLAELGIQGEDLERAMHPMQSFHDQLKEEVEAYERMRRGDLEILYNLTSIGRWLIGIRLARGMTQRELAERLGISESQVSRDENNEYHGISVERAQKILEALDVRFRMEIEEPLTETEPELARA